MSRHNAAEVILAGLSLAVRHATGTSIPVPDGSYRVIHTREEAELWVMTRTTHIALDIESDRHPDIHPSFHQILCLGLCDGTETVILPEHLFAGRLWPELADYLEAVDTDAHNGPFDAAVLGWKLRGRNAPVKITHDSMLAHYALWPAGSSGDSGGDTGGTARAYHALKVIGPMYRGCESWQLRSDEYSNMRGVPLDRLYTYNAKDVQNTWLLMETDFLPQFKHQPRQYDAYRTVLMPASHHIAWMNDFGCPIDVPYTEDTLMPLYTQKVQDRTREVIDLVNRELPGQTWPLITPAKRLPEETSKTARRFNPGSADQVRTVLGARGVELPVDRKAKDKTKGTTGEKVLKKLLATTYRGDEFLTKLLDFRGAEKLLGTYIKPLSHAHDRHPHRGLRVFPSYSLHKTDTGRLSSAGDTNIQNQPKVKEIRRAHITCDEGRILTQCDYGQAELRVMAVLGHDSFLMEVFSDPTRDLFNELTPRVYSTVDFSAADLKNTDDPLLKPYRRPLKSVVYGLAYDRGAAAIGDETGTSTQVAAQLIQDVLAAMQGVAGWRQDVIRIVDAERPLVSRFGRYFLHPAITDKNRADILRSGLAFLPQSSASDCCLLAAIALGEHIREHDLDWEMRAMIHDAIILDVPEGQEKDAAELTGRLMAQSAARWFPEVPFATDASFGTSWADL